MILWIKPGNGRPNQQRAHLRLILANWRVVVEFCEDHKIEEVHRDRICGVELDETNTINFNITYFTETGA